MKFIACFQLKPGVKNQMADAFESRGPNRAPGVTFRGAWIGASEDVLFVLAEADDQAAIDAAGQNWRAFGDYELHRVIDVESF